MTYFSNYRKHYFPDVTGGVHGFGVPPVNVRQQPTPNAGAGARMFGANWGRGQALGRN